MMSAARNYEAERREFWCELKDKRSAGEKVDLVEAARELREHLAADLRQRAYEAWLAGRGPATGGRS
jgi:hypothetical protein